MPLIVLVMVIGTLTHLRQAFNLVNSIFTNFSLAILIISVIVFVGLKITF